jgi:hypothetical protein
VQLEHNLPPDALKWMSCNIPNEPASSTIDFVDYWTMRWKIENATSMNGIRELESLLEDTDYNAPTLFDGYRPYKLINGTLTMDNETVSQAFNMFHMFFSPYGPFRGSAWDQW